MSKVNNKKLAELEYGKHFVDWVNQNFGFDYCAVENKEEYSDIDIYGISITRERLNLQIVSSNGPTMKLASENDKRFQEDKDLQVLGVKTIDWVTKAVKDKLQKFYSKPEQLIILIEGFLPTPTPDEIEEIFKEEINLPFKGVYYVSLPVKSSTNLTYETNGYVVTIKNAWKN